MTMVMEPLRLPVDGWSFGTPPGLSALEACTSRGRWRQPRKVKLPYELEQSSGDECKDTVDFLGAWRMPASAAVHGGEWWAAEHANDASLDFSFDIPLDAPELIHSPSPCRLTQDLLAQMDAVSDRLHSCEKSLDIDLSLSPVSLAAQSPQLKAFQELAAPQLHADAGLNWQLPALHEPFMSNDETKRSECRWHTSANTVGVVSNDGHVFTKTAGPRRCRMSDRGAQDLATLCMVFDASLRCGGVHKYVYHIMDGELGAADGAGFVFDTQVRRGNIQRMRSVFLNQRGRICIRDQQRVTRLQEQLPPLAVGTCVTLLINLESSRARFEVCNSYGGLSGAAEVSLDGMFAPTYGGSQIYSGFFCAVVTGNITVGIS